MYRIIVALVALLVLTFEGESHSFLGAHDVRKRKHASRRDSGDFDSFDSDAEEDEEEGGDAEEMDDAKAEAASEAAIRDAEKVVDDRRNASAPQRQIQAPKVSDVVASPIQKPADTVAAGVTSLSAALPSQPNPSVVKQDAASSRAAALEAADAIAEAASSQAVDTATNSPTDTAALSIAAAQAVMKKHENARIPIFGTEGTTVTDVPTATAADNAQDSPTIQDSSLNAKATATQGVKPDLREDPSATAVSSGLVSATTKDSYLPPADITPNPKAAELAADAVSQAQEEERADATSRLRGNVPNAMQFHTSDNDEGTFDISKEAGEVEAEEEQMLSTASGDEQAEAEDEEFENSVDDVSERAQSTAEAVDQDRQDQDRQDQQDERDEGEQLQDTASENDEGDGDFFAENVKDEAAEVQGEDAKIESESLAEQRADRELDSMAPVDRPAETVSLSVSPSDAAASHVVHGRQHHKHRSMKHAGKHHHGKKAATSGSAVDAMRKALAATLGETKPLSKTPAVQTTGLSITGLGTPTVAAESATGLGTAALGAAVGMAGTPPPQVLAGPQNSGLAAALRTAGLGLATPTSASVAATTASTDAMEHVLIQRRHQGQEGNEADENLDAVERVIASDATDGTSSGGSDGTGMDDDIKAKTEQLDDVEAAVVADDDGADDASPEDDANDSDEA